MSEKLDKILVRDFCSRPLLSLRNVLFILRKNTLDSECLVEISSYNFKLLWSYVNFFYSFIFMIKKPGKRLGQKKYENLSFKSFTFLILMGSVIMLHFKTLFVMRRRNSIFAFWLVPRLSKPYFRVVIWWLQCQSLRNFHQTLPIKKVCCKGYLVKAHLSNWFSFLYSFQNVFNFPQPLPPLPPPSHAHTNTHAKLT